MLNILLFNKPSANNVQTKLRAVAAPCIGAWLTTEPDKALGIVESARSKLLVPVPDTDAARSLLWASWLELLADAANADTEYRKRMLAVTAAALMHMSDNTGNELPEPTGALRGILGLGPDDLSWL